MTIEEIINTAFLSNKKYDNYWDFRNDPVFMDYLFHHFPAVYDFVTNQNVAVVYSHNCEIAAIGLTEEKKISLYLNPDRITFIKEEKWDKNNFPNKNYQCIAGILLHEFLHFYLKHFSEIITEKNSAYLNYAQDIIIDNLIKQQLPEWRNWKDYIDKINEKNDGKEGIKKISLVKESDSNFKYVLDMYDWELAYILEKFGDGIEPQEKSFEGLQNKNTTEKSKQAGEGEGEVNQGNGNMDEKKSGSGFNSSKNTSASQNKLDKGNKNKGNDDLTDNKEGNNKEKNENDRDEKNKREEIKGQENEDMISEVLDELAKKQRERESLKSSHVIYKDNGEFNIGDEIVKAVYEKRSKNLYNFLVRFLRKVNEKSKLYTWRKVNKRYPGYFPGYKRVVKPGDVLVIVDTSGSMFNYLAKYYSMVISEIKDCFEKIEKVFGQPSNFYYVDVSEGIHNRQGSDMGFIRIDRIQKLIDVGYTLGRLTDYRDIFERIVDWRKTSFSKKSKSNLPDIILFLSDMEVDFSFAYNKKGILKPIYKKIGERLIWLKVGSSDDPPFGYVIDVDTPIWSRIRRING